MTFRPRTLSVSMVQLYLTCPAQWKARYIDKLVQPTNPPLLFGKAFHTALEAEHKGENSERALVAAWNQREAELAASGQVMHPGKAHALALLDAYKAQGLGGKMGRPELKFTLPLLAQGMPPVTGYIDLPIPERRRFREFKTTSTTTRWTHAKIALEFQLHVYGRAYQATYHHRPECGEYVIFGTDAVRVEPIEAVPSPDGFRLFETAAVKVLEAAAAGRFDGCGKSECWICKTHKAEKPGKAGPSFEWDEVAS